MPKRKKTNAFKPAPARATTARPARMRATKQERLLALLRRPEGVTIWQAAKALDWQPHSVRGVISGVLKKRLGLTVTSDKGDDGRVYRVTTDKR